MGVLPQWRGRGAGRLLLERACADLAADGVRYLTVKTLGPSDPDPAYAQTRAFYQALGFEPLMELADLWPDQPCLVMVRSLNR